MKKLKVYKSSAGSGKTFTLVLEFLALVLKDPQNYRRILAVTFTNKAAYELKERLLDALYAIANHKDDGAVKNVVLPYLISETMLDEQVLRDRATIVFHHILHHYSEFAVSTIDAFVQKLARTFTRELQLPAQYEILLETDILINLTRDRIIASVGRDKFVTRLILDFIKGQLQEDENWRIEYRLGEFIKLLLEEEAFLSGKGNELTDLEAVQKAGKTIRDYRNKVLQHANQQISKIEQLLSQHDVSPEDLNKGKNGLPVVIKRIREGDFAYASEASLFKNPPEAGKWAKGKLHKGLTDAIFTLENELISLFDELRAYVEEHRSRLTLFNMLANNLLSFALQQRINEEMALLRNERNEVHISEFNKRLSTTLYEASVPYIYERLGERYRHFMLDEFQDTSILQWQNFLPLLTNGLSAGNLSLLVGDAKQAIYRFRSGEVEQFIRLPETNLPVVSAQTSDMAATLQQQYQDFSLDTNYRSLPGIVKFNNAFFKSAVSFLSEDYQAVYEHVAQQFVTKNAEGFVYLEMFLEVEKNNETDPHQLRVVELVAEIIESGYAPGDIAILTRQNDHGANMARFLTQQGYSVVSPDSLLVKNSDKVQLLVHALYFVLQPANSMIASGLRYYNTLVRATNSPESIEADTYFAAQEYSSAQMEQFLGLPPGSLNPVQLNHYSIYDFCEHLVRIFELQNSADPYLMFFLEAVFRWQNQSQGGLGDFLQYWEDRKDKLAVSLAEDAASIKVMTIHKAKGLEFPVVIYPYAFSNLGNRTTKNHAWIDLSDYEIPGLKQAMISVNKSLAGSDFEALYEVEKQKSQLDNMNLMYVAYTRAIEQLYVLSTVKGEPEKTLQYHFLSQTGDWVSGKNIYTFGNKDGLPLKKSSEQLLKKETSDPIVSRNWHKALKIAHLPAFSIATKAIQYGNKMHTLLAQLRYADQLHKVLQKNFQLGFIDQTEVKTLASVFVQLTANPKLSQAYSRPAKIKNEVDLYLTSGELLRPDRIAVLPEKVLVIDYKTGEPNDNNLSQISDYKNALQKLFIQPVEGYLVYLKDTIEIISV
jgi:ATP-dependent exoDNAse (exonuclease V) beta subunit